MAQANARRQTRLPYLDGLRAVAAIYVVMFHAIQGFATYELTGPWRLFKASLGFGHEAVALFIVLSGYCLMLPTAASHDQRMTTSFGVYVGRRAFRILPPYFVACAATLLAIFLVPALSRAGTGTIWDESLPAFELAPLLSHLLLVHNWFPELAYRINGPHWSVATEWQIYFCFPLLLLPLWRRFGWLVTCAVAGVIGYAPLLLVPRAADKAIPWYLLLFVLGMLAASIGHSEGRKESSLRRLDWKWISAACWGGCLSFGLGAPRVWFQLKPLTDLCVGLATAALLVYLTEQVHATRQGQSPRPVLLKLLESKPALGVGHLSYSLYLTHLPVVALCYFALVNRGFAAPTLACLVLVSSLSASLVVAYLFHHAVERHFMNRPRWLPSNRDERR